MFQSSHYSWSVAKNFVPLFPFVFLFLLSCYVRTSFYAAPAKYKLLGCRTVVGLGGCVRRAMAEEGRGGWEYLGSALGFASVWCVIVSACVCCVSKWDPNRKTSRTRMFRPSWGRCLVIVARFRVATFAIVSFHYGSLPSKRQQQQGWCATQILPTKSVRRRPQRVGRFDSATVAATTTRMARPARSRQVRTSRCLPPKGELIQQRHCIARCKNRDDTIVSPLNIIYIFYGLLGTCCTHHSWRVLATWLQHGRRQDKRAYIFLLPPNQILVVSHHNRRRHARLLIISTCQLVTNEIIWKSESTLSLARAKPLIAGRQEPTADFR